MHTTPAPSHSAVTTPRRLWALLGLLALVAAAGVIVNQYRQRPPTLEERLHGDSDEATVALDDLQARTPADQKLAQLVRLSQDPSPGTRYAAVDALEGQRGPAAVAAAEQAFTDSSAQVRQRAMEILPKLDRERGLRLLLRGLRDEDTWIRQAAVQQLRQYGDGRDVPALLGALNDPDPAVSNFAMGVLRAQTGQPFYASVRAAAEKKRAVITAWQRWWQTTGRSRYPADPVLTALAPLRPERSDPAPDFAIQDVNGGFVRLADERGHVALLNFWGTWCPPCQQEIPDLVRLDRDYRLQGLNILGIALGEKDAQSVRSWCRAHGVLYRQALATEPVQKVYGDVTEVPVSVLIDRHGRLRYRWDGERDFATFRAAVTRLLAEP